MKRILLLLLLSISLVLTTSCGLVKTLGFGSGDGRKPSDIVRDEDDKAKQGADSSQGVEAEEGLENEGEPEAAETEANDELLDPAEAKYAFLDEKAIKAGSLEGFGIEMGMDMEAVNELYGPVLESDYYQGGKFNLYDTEDYRLFVFDADLGLVNNVMLAPKFDFKISEAKDRLGEANYEGLDDESGEWLIIYYFTKYSLYIHGQDDDIDGKIAYFLIKQEF